MTAPLAELVAFLRSRGHVVSLDADTADAAGIADVETIADDPYRFGRHRFAGASLLTAGDVAALPDGRGELVASAWRPTFESASRVT